MIYCKTSSTHMKVNKKLSTNDNLAKYNENVYKCVVGSYAIS